MEHLEKLAENLIEEHLFYTLSIATNNAWDLFHCININSQMYLTIWDTRVWVDLSPSGTVRIDQINVTMTCVCVAPSSLASLLSIMFSRKRAHQTNTS